MDADTVRLAIELIVGLLVTPFAIVMWFLLRKTITDLAAVEKALNDHKLSVANNYIQKEDFNRTSDALFKKLETIENYIREIIKPT